MSGYSQAMMKMFLDEGQFGDSKEDQAAGAKDGKAKKGETEQPDPMAGLWKAIGHKAYDVLKVVD